MYVADQQGFELRPHEGLDGIKVINPRDPSILHIVAWKHLIESLEARNDCNVVALNYDFRKWGCPRYSKTMPLRFRELVEQANDSTGSKVMVVGHSMGCAITLYCL